MNQRLPPAGILTRPPLRSLLYFFLIAELLLVQLPVRCLLVALFPAFAKPHRKWTRGRSVLIPLLRHFSVFGQRLRVPVDVIDKKSLPRLDPRHATAIWIPRLDSKTNLQGEMKEMFDAGACVTERIPAYWIGENHAGQLGHNAKPDERVIIFFHGGGYQEGNGLPTTDTANLVKIALRGCAASNDTNAPRRVLSIEYRLTNQTTFPGIFADALAAWTYLVRQLFFKPRHIFFLGNSSGGNLVLALLRYIRDEGPFWAELGLPLNSPIANGVILSSPWIDVSGSFLNTGPSSSAVRFADTDLLTRFFLQRAMLPLLQGLPEHATYSKWISPVTIERDVEEDLFDDFPRTLCFYGGLEIFVDEIMAFSQHYDRAVRAGKAQPLQLEVESYAVHDYLVVLMTFKEEQNRAEKIIAKWLKGE